MAVAPLGDARRFDPGETAALILRLRNYGASTSTARVELTTTDPYVAILAGTADYGPVPAGGVVSNLEDILLLRVSPDAPEGWQAELTATVAHDGGTTVSRFSQCVGRRHFLVWDPTFDASSGETIYRTLRGLRFSGRYATALNPAELADCQSVWISLGVRPYNWTVQLGSGEAQAIGAFVAGGGCAYLEGADIWYADPASGAHDFGPLFKITAYHDGSGDLYQVVGDPGTFAAGILMSYLGENNSIDRLSPILPAFRLCRNNAPTYGCVIAQDNGTSRTVGASIEFAGLRDGQYPNTKSELALRIMRFFIPNNPQGMDPTFTPGPRSLSLDLTPNPWTRGTALHCRARGGGLERLDLYDAAGRRLGTLHEGPLSPGMHTLQPEAGSLAPGCYFVGPPDAGKRGAVKLVVLR